MQYRVLFLILAATLSPAPAGAADESVEARKKLESYSQCVVERYHRDAVEAVLSTAPSNDLLRQHPNLVVPTCLGPMQLRIRGADFLRYGLADALLQKDYANGLPADIESAAPLAHFQVDDADYQPKPGKTMNAKALAELQAHKDKALAIRATSIYAECVARKDPQGVLRLVFSEPGSEAENQAFAALNLPLASCLPEGQTIRIERFPLRGALAMNLYRLAKAPRVAPAAAGQAK